MRREVKIIIMLSKTCLEIVFNFFFSCKETEEIEKKKKRDLRAMSNGEGIYRNK
jgi:hypothetical protein